MRKFNIPILASLIPGPEATELAPEKLEGTQVTFLSPSPVDPEAKLIL